MMILSGIVFLWTAGTLSLAADIQLPGGLPGTYRMELPNFRQPSMLIPSLEFGAFHPTPDFDVTGDSKREDGVSNKTASEGQRAPQEISNVGKFGLDGSGTFPAESDGGGAGRTSNAGGTLSESPLPQPDHFIVSSNHKKWEVEPQGIKWGNVFAQSMLFLGMEHGFRLLDPNQPYTREALKGPFFKDWFDTVKDLKGWSDSDPAIINYIGHPVQGAVSGRILIQNDPSSKYLEIGYNEQYRASCLKAFGFAFVYGLQFELGPISEASIGNSSPTPDYPHPTSYVDLVITPTVGTAWLVAEDLADRYLMGAIERRTNNRSLVALARTFSNPSRSMANFLRFKWFWYRDNRY